MIIQEEYIQFHSSQYFYIPEPELKLEPEQSEPFGLFLTLLDPEPGWNRGAIFFLPVDHNWIFWTLNLIPYLISMFYLNMSKQDQLKVILI